VRPIAFSDFAVGMQQVRASVSQKDLKQVGPIRVRRCTLAAPVTKLWLALCWLQYLDWNAQYGSFSNQASTATADHGAGAGAGAAAAMAP
jgi:hypothetical protein